MNSDWNKFLELYLNNVRPSLIQESLPDPITVTLKNKIDLTVRVETEADYREVEELTHKAFWLFDRKASLNGIGCDEHYLCKTLRTTPEFVPELDLIAECEIGGRKVIVGNVMFSVGYVKDKSGEFYIVLNFGPLSVLPEFRKTGVGSAIMYRAIELARSFGWGGIIFYGHPTYYPRLGFVEMANFGITTLNGDNFPAFMGMELIPGYLSDIGGGSFHESPDFQVDNQKACEYDANFPTIADGFNIMPITEMHLPFLHRLMNLHQILSSLHQVHTGLDVWQERYKIWLDDSDEENFIIYSGARPAGWLKLNGLNSSTGWISMLVIDPEYARNGFGSKAIEYAEQYFTDRGIYHVGIHTNADNSPAQGCYEKAGYTLTQKGDCTNGDGEHRLGYTYEKHLQH